MFMVGATSSEGFLVIPGASLSVKWCDGATGRALDLRSIGRGFNPTWGNAA